MCWTSFETIGHISKNLDLSENSSSLLVSQAGYGPANMTPGSRALSNPGCMFRHGSSVNPKFLGNPNFQNCSTYSIKKHTWDEEPRWFQNVDKTAKGSGTIHQNW